ncbi:unnamed protein product, partial [Symbiodinium sp. KB8]
NIPQNPNLRLRRSQDKVGFSQRLCRCTLSIGARVMASGTALLSAAVKAACQAKAPRRTIAAIAAAVTQVLTHPVPAAVATPATVPDVPLGSLESQDELELKLREVRLAKRRAKRQRRRAKAKAAASMADAKKPFASTWD